MESPTDYDRSLTMNDGSTQVTNPLAERLEAIVPGHGEALAAQVRDHIIPRTVAVAWKEPGTQAEIEEALNAGTVVSMMVTPGSLQNILGSVGVFCSLNTLASKSLEDRVHALAWAFWIKELERPTGEVGADRALTAPERPEWLPARDSESCARMIYDDRLKHGGQDEAFREFGDDWKERETPPAANPDGRFMEWLRQLEEVGDDELIADLVAVGVDVVEPTKNSNPKLMAFIDRLFESMTEDEALIADNNEAERIQIQLIRSRYNAAREIIEFRTKRAQLMACELAIMFVYPDTLSTIQTPHGEFGYLKTNSVATEWFARISSTRPE